MITTEQFIADPWQATRAGYKPTFLSCVAAMAHGENIAWRGLWEEFISIRDVWNMTVGDLVIWVLYMGLGVPFMFTLPVTGWFLGAWLYFRIRGYKARLEQIEHEEDEQV